MSQFKDLFFIPWTMKQTHGQTLSVWTSQKRKNQPKKRNQDATSLSVALKSQQKRAIPIL
jgi:hypothetical protein